MRGLLHPFLPYSIECRAV